MRQVLRRWSDFISYVIIGIIIVFTVCATEILIHPVVDGVNHKYLKSHSDMIIKKINKYSKIYPNYTFIYNYESYINASRNIGENPFLIGPTKYMAMSVAREMISKPNKSDIHISSFPLGETCIVLINPARFGSMGDYPNDGIFNIDFDLLHEVGHCVASIHYLKVVIFGLERAQETFADMYAIEQIKRFKLNVNIDRIISGRREDRADIKGDPHQNAKLISYFINKKASLQEIYQTLFN